MLKILKIIIPIVLLIFFIQPVLAQDKVNIYFFYGDGCPHCAKEKKFLDELKIEIPEIEIHAFEVWNNVDNARFLAKLGRELKFDISGVPLTIIGDRIFSGFYSAATTGAQIKTVVENYLENGCSDIVASALNLKEENNQCIHGCNQNDEECIHDCGCSADNEQSSVMPGKIRIPLVGEIDIKNFSLPVLTILIAAADGFNPCAMWILLFLISLFLGMQNRKRMWILGASFIIASGLAYFLFMAAWLSLFLFLGFVLWIRIIIGLVALASGGYHLYDYWRNRDGKCKVTDSAKRKRIFDRLRNIVQMKKFWLALSGIIILAFAVNLVELVCSAGLPAVYIQVLALANLAQWQYYGYLLLYIFIFILEDLLIFVIAMATLRMKAIIFRYTRGSGLVGGIIRLIIVRLLIFKPGLLMFG